MAEENLAFTSSIMMLHHPPDPATPPPRCPPGGHPQQEPRVDTPHCLLRAAASWADGDQGCSSASLRLQQTSASSTDTASSLSSRSSEDGSLPSPHGDTEVRVLTRPSTLGRGTQVCSPTAPRLRPLAVAFATQQAPSPLAGEAEGPRCTARHFSKRKLSAFTPEGCERREEPTPPCPMYRLVLAGDRGTGKSSFLLRLCTNEFRGDISSTLGVDFQIKQLLVDGEQTTLQVWDTAGQERPPRGRCRSCWWGTRRTCGPACLRQRGSAQPTGSSSPWPTAPCSARPVPRTAPTWWRRCCTLPGEEPHGPRHPAPGCSALAVAAGLHPAGALGPADAAAPGSAGK
ncbi:uncharacterized protein VSU04_009577 isoform 3-T3 [Chlamydotis macqueenii]